MVDPLVSIELALQDKSLGSEADIYTYQGWSLWQRSREKNLDKRAELRTGCSLYIDEACKVFTINRTVVSSSYIMCATLYTHKHQKTRKTNNQRLQTHRIKAGTAPHQLTQPLRTRVLTTASQDKSSFFAPVDGG